MPTPAIALSDAATATAVVTLSSTQVLDAVDKFHTLYTGAWTTLSNTVFGLTVFATILVPLAVTWIQTRKVRADERAISDAVTAAKTELLQAVADQKTALALLKGELDATKNDYAALISTTTKDLHDVVAAAETKMTIEIAGSLERLDKDMAKKLASNMSGAFFGLAVQSFDHEKWHRSRMFLGLSIARQIDAGDSDGLQQVTDLYIASIFDGEFNRDDEKNATVLASKLDSSGFDGATEIATKIRQAVKDRQNKRPGETQSKVAPPKAT